MSITGEPGGAPAKTGNSVADINAGILAVAGILAAYAHKLKTGEGQIVDTSLMEAALQQTYWHAAIYFATGESPGPTGSAHILTAPYQAFRASDGWINIGGANQANWERIADVLGHPEWRADPRFATNTARMANLDALTEAMNDVLATRSRSEWIEAFDAAGVPVGPVHTIGEALDASADASRAAWSSSSIIRAAGRNEGARLPDALFGDTDRCRNDRRRCSASTRAKCCASSDIRTRRSIASSPKASLKQANRVLRIEPEVWLTGMPLATF